MPTPFFQPDDPRINRNGRPKGALGFATKWRAALEKLAAANDKDPDEMELEIFQKGIASARSGDFRFYKDTMDRIHGMPKNTTDLNVEGAITIEIAEAIAKKNGITPNAEPSSQ